MSLKIVGLVCLTLCLAFEFIQANCVGGRRYCLVDQAIEDMNQQREQAMKDMRDRMAVSKPEESVDKKEGFPFQIIESIIPSFPINIPWNFQPKSKTTVAPTTKAQEVTQLIPTTAKPIIGSLDVRDSFGDRPPIINTSDVSKLVNYLRQTNVSGTPNMTAILQQLSEHPREPINIAKLIENADSSTRKTLEAILKRVLSSLNRE